MCKFYTNQGIMTPHFITKAPSICQMTRVDPGILEHYAVYAEKVKGDAFAYQFLMKQLGGGVRSLVMLQQLKSICAQMGIPDTAYDAIREKSVKLTRGFSRPGK